MRSLRNSTSPCGRFGCSGSRCQHRQSEPGLPGVVAQPTSINSRMKARMRAVDCHALSLRGLSIFVLVLAAGCSRPSGWFRADKAPTQEDLYDERFEPIVLASDGPCDPVRARQGEA